MFLLKASTVDVRKQNVPFEEPNKIVFGLKLFGSSQTSDNQTKPVPNRFVRFSDVRFGQPNQKSLIFKIRTTW